jgi:two-component system nitrate/nitrite response regulator NarL
MRLHARRIAGVARQVGIRREPQALDRARTSGSSAARYNLEVGLASLRQERRCATLDEVALRCLIVDDNEDFLVSASRLLKSQSVDVVGCASTGAEAIRLAVTLRPDVALVDLQLGDEDGLAVAVSLAASPHATQVILISTHSENDLLDLIAQSPAVGFLEKRAISASAIDELLA